MTVQWTWGEGALSSAAGEQLASVCDGVLATAAGERLTLESSLDYSSPRFFLRAQTAAGAGEDFSVSQAGITITRLRATCGEREYLLERRNPFRRERRIVARRSGAEVASTAPAGNGLQVSVGELPELDAIFLSYACALLDATPRTLRT